MAAEQQPYMPLGKAPKEIRRAAGFAKLANSISRITTILLFTYIIATLPQTIPGLLTLQPIPLIIVFVSIVSMTLSRRANKIWEKVCRQRLADARSSSLTGVILGFTIGGVLAGPFYLLLYMSLGKAMVKTVPVDGQVKSIYLPPPPSGGIFLGRYLGWITMYLYVLYIGYTELPDGLKGASDWLSPVFGIHLNTLIVASYLVLTNPITNPAILRLWLTAGLLGGLIAGGKTSRGSSVGLTVFLSSLGAMSLASLAIFRGFYTSLNSLNIPPPPPGFSLTALASGPIAQDIIPIILRPGASPLSADTIQNVLLVVLRNSGLVLAIVTVSGQAGALLWQGIVYLFKRLIKTAHPTKTKTEATQSQKTADSPTIRTSLILLLIIAGLCFSQVARAGTVSYANSPSNPYQQYLRVGFNTLGSPNASLQLANLDLSNQGFTIDSNFDSSNFTMLVINNNYSQGFGQGAASFPLGLFSKPALITMYTDPDPSISLQKSNNVAAEFSTALGTHFTYALSIPYGNTWINMYAVDPSISNRDMLAKTLAILPPNSFSSLFSANNIQGQKYSMMFGLIPGGSLGNFTIGRSFTFMLSTEWPRQFYKEGPHQFSLASLLGTSSSITGDPTSNSSIIAVTFQPGTTVSNFQPLSAYYVPYTLFLNATATLSTSDLTATFSYPFAPNVVVEKAVSPTSASVGASYSVTLSVKNLDNVGVSMVNLTDAQASSAYKSTMTLVPDATQTVQVGLLSAGMSISTSYLVTPKSSGVYVLSDAQGVFLWTLPNSTVVRYTEDVDGPVLTSQSGPSVQLGQSFNDLQPYSYLLLLPFVIPPVVETIRLVRRRSKPKETSKDGTSVQTVQQSR